MMKCLLLAGAGVLLLMATGCVADQNHQAETESAKPTAPVGDSFDLGISDEGVGDLERQAALDNAYEEGYAAGLETGQYEGYEQGYDEGYNFGFDEGCVALGERLIEIGVLDWYRCPSP